MTFAQMVCHYVSSQERIYMHIDTNSISYMYRIPIHHTYWAYYIGRCDIHGKISYDFITWPHLVYFGISCILLIVLVRHRHTILNQKHEESAYDCQTWQQQKEKKEREEAHTRERKKGETDGARELKKILLSAVIYPHVREPTTTTISTEKVVR